MFMHAADVKITHVPYRGAAPAVTDLIAGQIDGVVDNPPTVIAHIQAGKLRPLAVAAKERMALLPDVPTAAEAGVANFEAIVVVRHRRAGRHAAGDRRAAAPGDRRGGAHAGDASASPRSGARLVGDTPEEFAAQIRDERAQVGRDHQGREDLGRNSASGPAFARRARREWRARARRPASSADKCRIDHAVALDPALPSEGLRHDMDPEMGLPARPVAGVARHAGGIRRPPRRLSGVKASVNFSCDEVARSHGVGLGGHAGGSIAVWSPAESCRFALLSRLEARDARTSA